MIWGDSHLYQRLKANDGAAFELVVDQHYQAVFGQLWHFCRDREVAADLTQETFAQAWKSLDGFQGHSSIRTWLYTIAVRAWYKWKQNRASEPSTEALDEWAERVPDLSPGPAQVAESRARRREVQRALCDLPSPYHETMVLFYVQNLKYREVSEVLDVSIGTVKSRLHEGVRRLRAALDEPASTEDKHNPGDYPCETKTLNVI